MISNYKILEELIEIIQIDHSFEREELIEDKVYWIHYIQN
jgi:hypothetical protein